MKAAFCPALPVNRAGRLIAALTVLAAAFLFFASAAQAACREDTVDLRGPWGEARFTVEIADTNESRALGLMHRERMPRGAGMLFLYDAPVHATFWMRNTLIELDMIFVDETGVVTHVHHRAIPLDETVIDGGHGVLSVLEINGGLAEMLGLGVGSEIRHPRMPQDIAAWPCDAD